MDADELGVIELRFNVRHCPAHEMCLSTDVQPDVVAGRLAPVDIPRADEVNAAARLDDESIDPFVRRRMTAGRPSGAEVLACMHQRRLEAGGAVRLEQVIE